MARRARATTVADQLEQEVLRLRDELRRIQEYTRACASSLPPGGKAYVALTSNYFLSIDLLCQQALEDD